MSGYPAPSPGPAPRPLCAVYAPLLPLLSTGALSPEEERDVREHLADCVWCQNQRASYDVVEQALREHVGERPAYRPNPVYPVSSGSPAIRPTQPDEKLLTLEDIVSASQRNRPSTDSGWRDVPSGPAAPRDPRRRRPLIATLGAVAATLLIVTLAASLFARLAQRTPGPGSSPGTASCASILPGAGTGATATIPSAALPSGAVMGALQSSFGGPSQFTISQVEVCFSGTMDDLTGTAKGRATVANALASDGWSASSSFPYPGDLLEGCGGACYERGNTRYLAIDKVTNHGGNIITYDLRTAAPSAVPTCSSNFANSPISGVQTAVEGVPLPPITFVVPDNATNLHGYDLCSSGTATSVSAFLTSALPASGWTKGSDRRCFYTDECWTKGGNAISWNAGDPTDWHIAYHPMAG